jgi:hypothetical protein
MRTMRPKARGLAQHGGPPDWLEESDPAGCVFVRDGRSMPPALTTTPLAPVWGSSITKCAQNTVMSYTSSKEGMAWYFSRPMPYLR